MQAFRLEFVNKQTLVRAMWYEIQYSVLYEKKNFNQSTNKWWHMGALDF